MPDPTDGNPTTPAPTPPQPATAPADQSTNLRPCPACTRQVSLKAASCPNCGHPFEDLWKAVKRVGGIVFIAVGILGLGLQTVLLKLVKGQGVGGEELLPVFLQTAPLTIAVTLIVLSVLWKWVDGPFKFVVFSAMILFGSLILSSFLGNPKDIPNITGHPVFSLHKMVLYYWNIYGPSLFASALILGSFLAWAANKLWPLVIKGTPPSTASGSK